MKPKVEISSAVLAAMAATVVSSLLLVAFLLGRESARPSAYASPASVTTSSALHQSRLAESQTHADATLRAEPRRHEPAARPTAAPPPPPPKPSVDGAGFDRAASRQLTTERAVAPAAPVATVQPTSPQPAPAEREAVRTYLRAVDAIAVGSQTLDDPSGFANELLTQSLNGDNSGFDQLLRGAEESLRALEAVAAPPACREHHQLLLEQTRSGIALLRRVKTATNAMDTSTLTTLSAQGKAMQGQTARLEQLERQLRSY